jgi:glycosyltransferase involved in cell wall biosynthesis
MGTDGRIETLHIIGSKTMGGAERWFLRFTAALAVGGRTGVRVAVRRDTEMARQAALVHGEVEALPLRTVWDPLSRRQVGRTVRRLAPDLVQTYMGRATRLTRLGRPGRGGPVHVARLGGYYKLSGYRHAHAWIGNTKGLCDYLARGGLPADRVYQIYNFQDIPARRSNRELKALRRGLGLPESAWVLLAPGRLIPVKGHRYLVEAMARLPAEIDARPLRLVMLGEGTLRESLQEQARGLGVEGRLIWTGWRTDPDPFYQLADLVVFPSLERETFGNVVVEAWSHGRPLVTTEFLGALEITRHGEVWRVPCRNPGALAEGIRTLLQDRGLAGELVAKGLRRVGGEFSREVILGRYRELYERLLR